MEEGADVPQTLYSCCWSQAVCQDRAHPELCVISPVRALPGFWEQDFKVSPMGAIYRQDPGPGTKVEDLQAEAPGGHTWSSGWGVQQSRSCPPKGFW